MFAGIGGICLGFKQAGFEIVWANEKDASACRTYRYNFGAEYLIEGDIRKVDMQQLPKADVLAAIAVFLVALAGDALIQHLAADKAEQSQCDPGDELFKRGKVLRDGMYTQPTQYGHQCLEKGKSSGYCAHFAAVHARFVESVGQGYGKGVHCQPDAK